MRAMLRDIRRRARRSQWPTVPVIIENHTKDLGDFRPLEAFCRLLASQRDLEVITAAELAQNVLRGHYPVRSARCA
jgi:hypothetical protein